MTEGGVEVWLAALNPGVLATGRNTAIDKRLGRERMLFNARTAIERYQVRKATGGNAVVESASSSTRLRVVLTMPLRCVSTLRSARDGSQA